MKTLLEDPAISMMISSFLQRGRMVDHGSALLTIMDLDQHIIESFDLRTLGMLAKVSRKCCLYD